MRRLRNMDRLADIEDGWPPDELRLPDDLDEIEAGRHEEREPRDNTRAGRVERLCGRRDDA